MATVKDYPNDLRPSKATHLIGHIGGTTCELVMPLVLLFAVAMDDMDRDSLDLGASHLHHFDDPFAVPLEWNVFFIFCTGFLFANFPAGDGWGSEILSRS